MLDETHHIWHLTRCQADLMCHLVVTSHNHLQITAAFGSQPPFDRYICSSQWQLLKSLGTVAHQLQ